VNIFTNNNLSCLDVRSCTLSVASISGKDMFSVALDEGHEMEINLKSENALISFSQSYLATLTYYLPFRAKTLHNFKLELNLEEVYIPKIFPK
jgi:hypothetical protein